MSLKVPQLSESNKSAGPEKCEAGQSFSWWLEGKIGAINSVGSQSDVMKHILASPQPAALCSNYSPTTCHHSSFCFERGIASLGRERRGESWRAERISVKVDELQLNCSDKTKTLFYKNLAVVHQQTTNRSGNNYFDPVEGLMLIMRIRWPRLDVTHDIRDRRDASLLSLTQRTRSHYIWRWLQEDQNNWKMHKKVGKSW